MADADIKMQGVSLHDLLEKYFVAPELGLLDDAYWADYKGFTMILNVSNTILRLLSIEEPVSKCLRPVDLFLFLQHWWKYIPLYCSNFAYIDETCPAMVYLWPHATTFEFASVQSVWS